MTALESGWLQAKNKDSAAEAYAGGRAWPHAEMTPAEEDEEDEEEVFSRLNSLSDSEDGAFGLSKAFYGPAAAGVAPGARSIPYERGFEPQYTLGPTEDQRLTLDCALFQTFADGPPSDTPASSTPASSTPASVGSVPWNAGIFDAWCSSLDSVVADNYAPAPAPAPQVGGVRVYQRSQSVCTAMPPVECTRMTGPAVGISPLPRGMSAGRVLKRDSAGSTRRGSCSSLYGIPGAPAFPHPAHGTHHPAVYKYVAQAQLSMQCNTTKVEMANKAEWLPVSPMTPERSAHIIAKLQEKNVLLDTAYEVFELFPRQNFLSQKLELLAMEFEPHFAKNRTAEETAALMAEDAVALNRHVWLNQREKRHAAQLKQFPRFTVREAAEHHAWPYQIEVRTSSGYNDFTAQDEQDSQLSHMDFLLMRLRHMNLLRESDDRKRKTKYYEFIEGKMKRPLNSFMLYRSALMKALSILKVVKIVTDLVRAVSKELPTLDERAILGLLVETVKSRRGSTYLESPHIPRLSVLIDEHLYKQQDGRGSGSLSMAGGVPARVPVDPKFSNHTVLAQVITLMWNSESTDCREGFVLFSKVEKNHHHLVYPKYKYCPVKKLKLEELERNLNITTFSPDLLDGFKNLHSAE
ncbi:AaceriAGL345Wp [[Ashbya] aceris (nom. inval.)]|nr:AaceriAGL345Wp [[Ashbya] aceris (nom. inval.)]